MENMVKEIFMRNYGIIDELEQKKLANVIFNFKSEFI